MKVTLPVGAKPPVRVAESEIRPPAGTAGDARVEIAGVAAGRRVRNPPPEPGEPSPTAMQPPAPHARSHRLLAPPTYWAEPGTSPEIGTIALKLKLLSEPTATHEVEHAMLPREPVPGTVWAGPATPLSMATTMPS